MMLVLGKEAAIFQRFIFSQQILQIMKAFDRVDRQSPTRFNTDVYIITHSKSKSKKQVIVQNVFQNASIPLQQPLSPISKQSGRSDNFAPASYFYNQAVPEDNHRRNIDRLMGVLRQKSAGKIKKQKAVRGIYRWIQKKMERGSWLRAAGLDVIRKARVGLQSKYKQGERKHDKPSYSVEWKIDQIKKCSKNFDVNGELVNLVNTDQVSPIQASIQVSNNNSLSKNLREMSNSIESCRTLSQKKLSKEIYILNRPSMQELSTNNELASFKTEPLLKAGGKSSKRVKAAPSLSPKSNKGLHSEDLRLQSNINTSGRFCVDSTPSFSNQPIRQILQRNSPQETENGSSLLKQISIAKNIEVKRANRMMEGISNSQKVKKNEVNDKIINSRNNYYPSPSNQQQANGERGGEGRRFRSYSIGKISFTYSNKEIKTPNDGQTNAMLQGKPRQNNPSNQMRTSSTKTQMNTVNLGPQLPAQFLPLGSKVSAPKVQEEKGENRRRCNSMPKITFTYKSKQEVVNHQTKKDNLQKIKHSPIFHLNDMLRQHKKQDREQDDPYLTKNIQIRNIQQQKSPAVPQPKQIQNNYHLPPPNRVLVRQSYVKPVIIPDCKDKYSLFDIIRPANTPAAMQKPAVPQHFVDYKASQYYGVQPKPQQVRTQPRPQLQPQLRPKLQQEIRQQTMPQVYGQIQPHVHGPIQPLIHGQIQPQYRAQNRASPPKTNGRGRIISADTYILRRVSPVKQTNTVGVVVAERERARSLNPKMQVTLKKHPMIKVY